MENVINTLHLSGKVIGTPVVGHEAFGEKFYYLTLGVPRLSGAMDHLPVTLSERLLDGAMLADGDTLAIEGQVRSYNKIIEGAGRLLITAFAQKIVESDERENPNQIQLTGRLQSRAYQKQLPDGTVVEKTAYEVSVGHLELLSERGAPGDAPAHGMSDFRSNAILPQ